MAVSVPTISWMRTPGEGGPEKERDLLGTRALTSCCSRLVYVCAVANFVHCSIVFYSFAPLKPLGGDRGAGQLPKGCTGAQVPPASPGMPPYGLREPQESAHVSPPPNAHRLQPSLTQAPPRTKALGSTSNAQGPRRGVCVWAGRAAGRGPARSSGRGSCRCNVRAQRVVSTRLVSMQPNAVHSPITLANLRK